LQELPESLRWLASLSGHLVVVTDAQGLTVWVNDMFTRVTGHSLHDMQGHTPGGKLQFPQTDPATVAVLRAAVAQGQSCAGVEILNRTRGGYPIWLRMDILPVHDAQGRLTHFFSIQSDITAIRQSLDERREHITLLRDMALIGFWQRDLSTGLGQWDDVCRRIWGLQDGDAALTLAQAEQRLSGADREALRRYQFELAAGATQGEVSYTLGTPAGERHVRSLWRRREQTVFGVLIDTTSEQTLSAERARLLQALELAAPAAQLVFWRHDLATGDVQWLPAGQHPFAADREDRSRADDILDRVLPADRPAVLAARERARQVRDVIELEYRVHDRLGAVRHVLTRRLGVAGANGDVSEIVGVLIDVTMQREREIALRRLGLQQALALQALRAGCFRFDLMDRKFLFDAAMLRLYGLPASAAEMTFLQWLDLVHPEDRPHVRQRASALFHSPGPTAPERFRVCCPDGRVLWIETDRVVEQDAQGHAVALVGTHRDVTGEVAAQAQARALADAQVAARARAELLATLAHELRTPLNAVAGFSQLLQLGAPGRRPDAAVAGPARHIQTAGEMMTALLDDLSDLASADAGALRWQAECVPVLPLLAECRAWLQRHDASTQCRVEVDVTPPGLSLWADATRTRQIVLNLVGNALKYSDGTVALMAQRNGATVCIAVRDTGPGLDAAQQTRAFEPFERLGREGGSKPGSGLGLAVCRRLARLMGGDVKVRSAPGEGSEFSLLLPAAPAHAVAGDDAP
jgi:PAS domain S-box-containing protein